jgi:uncharacterized protein HemX
MAYSTEQNRIKVAKYRARVGLREAGYTEEEIREIVTSTNWADTTPQQVLAQYVEYDNEPGAGSSREPAQGEQELGQEEEGSALVGWAILGAIGVALGGFFLWFLSKGQGE